MRRGLVVLLAPLMFGATVVAQQQGVGVAGGQAVFFDQLVFQDKVTVVARLNPDEVVARMLSFDLDNDGKVVEAELVERMQPLIARGDANSDGALDAAEIRTLAASPAPAPQGRSGGFPFSNSYGFADDSSFSSRNHIEGALDDLKLAADTKEQALMVARTYVDTLEERAQADLLSELEPVLTPEQLSAFQLSLRTQFRTMTLRRSQDGNLVQTVLLRRLSLQPRLNQFRLPPEQNKQAAQALDRYNARVRMGEAERAELVGQLRSILNTEDRHNLSAALARRPVVANGGLASFFAVDGKAVVHGGVQGGVVGQIQAIETVVRQPATFK